MRCLVTGGAGFIGSALATQLVNNGNDVVIIDNLKTGYRENIPPKAIFIESSVCDALDKGELDSYSFDVIFL